MGITNSEASILSPVKRGISNFFYLSLHHQNNRFENISVFFYFPLSISVAKKKAILRYTKYWSGIYPPLHPQRYACSYIFDDIQSPRQITNQSIQNVSNGNYSKKSKLHPRRIEEHLRSEVLTLKNTVFLACDAV
jgi:hypothetical protein